jgi:lipoprotein-releasing system permease protein
VPNYKVQYKLIRDIARSLIVARWKQSFVAATGVAFSITMFISLLGFMDGLNQLLDGIMLNRTPHIRLYVDIKPDPNQAINKLEEFKNSQNFIRSLKPSNSRPEIYNSAAIIKAIKTDPRVLGISTKISAPVLFNSGTVDITGSVSGIDVLEESKLYAFADYLATGEALDLKNIPNSIILGKGVASRLLANTSNYI